MAFQKRIPPIKIKLNVDEFNKLIEILSNMTNEEDENISDKSSKLKDKLLRYTVPITEDDGNTVLDIRFYNNEITDLFYILFYRIKDMISVETDYFDVLIKVREKIKYQKMAN